MTKTFHTVTFGLLTGLLILSSCGGEEKKVEDKKQLLSKEELRSSIKQMEDSLKVLQSIDSFL